MTTRSTISRPGWRFWIDRGGTFTDVIGRSAEGRIGTCKLLSGVHQSDAGTALTAMRRIMDLPPDAALPPGSVSEVRIGTTVATNALLERQGEPVALLITDGFRDALRIAYQNRPDLFALHIRRPAPLYHCVVECRERVGADGQVLRPLDTRALEKDLLRLKDEGIRALAIVFMHGYRFPAHEREARALALRLGFAHVSVSHELNPVIKLVSRGDTTLVNAYLDPPLKAYAGGLGEQLGSAGMSGRLLFMQSSGGLADAASFSGKDSVLSGPAGGIVGMVESAALEGFDKVIGFDMGGTSTDVSIYDGEYERSEETTVAGARLRAAMLKIHTVAAGGGSILHFGDGRLQVGPRSAGARPGPAAYGLGGPLTVTDCNVLLGRLNPEFFPAVLGRHGCDRLDRAATRNAFATLAGELSDRGIETAPEALARQFQKIAVTRMANAIKEISIRRGHDPEDFVLACFGGAGPQHACQVADELGIRRVLIHPLAGLLSAWGMGLAAVSSIREHSVRAPLDDHAAQVMAPVRARLRTQVFAELARQGHDDPAAIRLTEQARVRYQGTDTGILVALNTPAVMAADFRRAHRRRFGFDFAERVLVVESLLIEASTRDETSGHPAPCEKPAKAPPRPVRAYPVCTAGEWIETPFFRRDQLLPGHRIGGPAIVLDEGATTVIEKGWQAEVTGHRQLLLAREAPPVRTEGADTRADPARLEVFNNLFMHIAEQMGATLQNTARSVNIKERLDFSCAVFDSSGRLIANAPHMPVHLGSMGESVAAVFRDNPDMQDGDVFMLNDPYRGGTHLPDITVISPVFTAGQQRADFYVASRGHHADIGGISPGSMPHASTDISEEGVLFSNYPLIRNGVLDEKALLERLGEGPWPARNPAQNLADLKAQVAANRRGLELLAENMRRHGRAVCLAFASHVQTNAAAAVRRVIARLRDGEFEYPMDNGLTIRVAVRVDRDHDGVTVDFTGTSAQHAGNFNAPFAVCRAAVLYVFRCLVDDPVPLNAGCLDPVRIVAPEGCLLNPRPPAAVVAGNVETSQCITNALFGALDVMAAAQGTMNNFTFGNRSHQYYETLAGGSGAGPGFDGCDAVQTHMTNSRLTDPEVLEDRYPVRIRRFSVREGSGGRGRHRGGDGVVREIEFLADMQAAILSGHRRIAPFGLHGGEPGRCGRGEVIRAGGGRETLAAAASVDLSAGDRILIETPGGGGYGTPGSGD